MSAEDELVERIAERISWDGGDFTRWDDDAVPDHNRWSWRGSGHGEAMREGYRRMARAAVEEMGAVSAEARVVALSDAEREALAAAAELAACGECGCHISHHHLCGGCSTTFYGPPEEGFPSSSCTCKRDFSNEAADALTAVVERIVAERVAAAMAPIEALVARHVGERHGCLSSEMHGYGCHQCWADEIHAALTAAVQGQGGEGGGERGRA